MVLIDGKSNMPSIGSISTNKSNVSTPTTLPKSMTETFLLQVSGPTIKAYEIANYEISENTTLDLIVQAIITDVDGNFIFKNTVF